MIEQLTTNEEIERTLEEFYENFMTDLKEKLGTVCLEALDKNAETKTYRVQSKHLLASTGYALCIDGEIISSYAGSVELPSEGRREGEAYAEEVAKEKDSANIHISLVAGKNYASYVARRRSVLDGGILYLQEEVPKVIEKLTQDNIKI